MFCRIIKIRDIVQALVISSIFFALIVLTQDVFADEGAIEFISGATESIYVSDTLFLSLSKELVQQPAELYQNVTSPYQELISSDICLKAIFLPDSKIRISPTTTFTCTTIGIIYITSLIMIPLINVCSSEKDLEKTDNTQTSIDSRAKVPTIVEATVISLFIDDIKSRAMEINLYSAKTITKEGVYMF